MNLQKKIVLCECNSLEHQIVFLKFDDEPDTVYMQVHLTHRRNFFDRLIYGLKYALGHTSNYGAWDEFVLEKSSLREMREFLAKEV